MRCGRRWPPMTRCCARRSRRTAASCSSTPVTVCAPRSPRRGRAVDAAVAAQRALELPVRMGLATGEAELRDGDYFGTVLNRAARVMAAGHGGQILVADSTAVLLSGVDLARSGTATAAGCAEPDHGVSAAGAGPAHGLSAVAGTRYAVLGICGLPPAASSDVSPNSTRCKWRSMLIGW